MTTLDKPELIKAADKSNMAGYILDMPKQIKESLNKIDKIKIPAGWSFKNGPASGGKKIKNMCLCGMGGSAIANHIVTNLPAHDRKIPIKVVRGYEVPAWVDQNSLVILTSHSGATAETISAFKSAADKEAKIFIVAERGQLEELGAQEKAVVFDYDTLAPPRASLGYQLGAVFGLLNKLKIIDYDIQPALVLLNKLNQALKPKIEVADNLAKTLAYCCIDRLPIVVASGILKSVAWRWKTQINENANHLAFTEFLPEAMHNALQGLDLPKHWQENLIYLILQNSFDRPQLINQFDKLKNVLDDKKIRYEIIASSGEDIFSQKLSLVLLGDWVSFYLALLMDQDPTPVETIQKAKK